MHELQCATHESFVFEVNASCSGEFEKDCCCFFGVFSEQKFRNCTFWTGFATGDGPLSMNFVDHSLVVVN